MMCRFLVVRLAALVVLTVSLVPVRLHAQVPGAAAAALSAEGDRFFDGRDYKSAIADYTKLLQGYPNSEFATDAQFHLAYAQFLTAQFQPAADGLRKLLAAPTSPPELLEQAAALLPQVLAQQAGALKADDPKRTASYEAAIKEYDAFVTKYPRSTSLETALYGRALAAYQIARYDAAARDLRQNLAAFPTSDTILDSTFLLSITLATEANLALAKEDHPPAEAAAAFKNYVEAEKLLNDIIAKRTDISLANDAQFQLGETLMAHAGNSPETARVPLYQAALVAYRSVQPKEPMIAAQIARVARINDARIAELRKGATANRVLTRQLDARRLSEQTKLEALQAKEDPVLTARLQGGAVFYDLRRYDETRVLMTTLAAVVKKPEDEKLVLYYTASSYVGQSLIDKAVEAYDKFQAKFQGDPIAEGLPLLVGNLFLSGPKADPAKADKYFDDFARLYPKSRMRETALLVQADADAAQGQYDEALKTLDTFLKGHPKPELVAQAELSRARILRDKKDFDGALTAFRAVRDKYKTGPEGEEAAFWVGWTLLQKKDAAGAVTELTAFGKQYPQSKFLPGALLTLAQAQQATNAKDPALATLTDLYTRFPQSTEGQGAYFLSANIYLTDKKYDDMARVLTAFVDKYPDSDQAFAAYERIGAVQTQANQPEAAAATYEKFLSKQPDSPHAADVVARLAALWLRTARGMGSFIVLGAPQREAWTRDVKNSVAACERAVSRYPDAPATALALQTLLDAQRLLIEAKVQTPPQVVDYFQALADKNADKPAARSRILFRLASLTAEKDPAKALADMQAAYDPVVVYSPADLDAYGTALLKADPSAAAAVFDKLAKDYPLPPGATSPAQAAPDVQEAQALALYGRGTLAQAAGKEGEAAQAFGELKKNYPRSSKVAQANLGLAESAIAKGKPEDALPLLSEVARASTAPVLTRARGLFLNGEVQAAKGQDGAIDAYLKVAAFYPTSPDAAEGLWKGGQLLEKQAATLTETPSKPGAPTKSAQLARARKAYEDLTTKYADSKWTAQAKARLAALPVVAK